MTKIYRIPTGQVEGNGANDTNTSEIRPYGEIAVYVGDNNKLELLMFDGVRTHVRSKVLNKGTFYGGDADSADGAGYDSIKLVPDEELRRSGSQQYIIVEPTGGEPGHVHIRAGGTIDSSTADLFLGGELNHVRVSDTSNIVTISADANDNGATRNWYFNSSGSFSLPGIEDDATAAIDFFGGSNNHKVTLHSDWTLKLKARADGPNEGNLWLEAGQNTKIKIKGNGSTIDVVASDGTETATWTFDKSGNLSVPGGFIQSSQITGLNLASNYDVHIVADYTDNNHEWIFEASTAELTVPGAIKSKTNPATGTQVANLPYTLGAGAANGYVGLGAEWNAVIALGDLTGYTLTAQQTGSTIFTTTITQMRDNLGGQPAFQTADGLPSYSADITFTLTSPDYAPQTVNNLELAAGNNTWTFSSTTGGLTFPDGTTQTTAFTGPTVVNASFSITDASFTPEGSLAETPYSITVTPSSTSAPVSITFNLSIVANTGEENAGYQFKIYVNGSPVNSSEIINFIDDSPTTYSAYPVTYTFNFVPGTNSPTTIALWAAKTGSNGWKFSKALPSKHVVTALVF